MLAAVVVGCDEMMLLMLLVMMVVCVALKCTLCCARLLFISPGIKVKRQISPISKSISKIKPPVLNLINDHLNTHFTQRKPRFLSVARNGPVRAISLAFSRGCFATRWSRMNSKRTQTCCRSCSSQTRTLRYLRTRPRRSSC